jgi:hypothetical protein
MVSIDWYQNDIFMPIKILPDINFRPVRGGKCCGCCKEVRLLFNERVWCDKYDIGFPEISWFATDYICDSYH